MVAEAGAPTSPDPFDALERVVRNLGEELAFFRRRALDAERRLRDVLAQQQTESGRSGATAFDVARLTALETENGELRLRLAEAAERARGVASRLRFARQQDDAERRDVSGTTEPGA